MSQDNFYIVLASNLKTKDFPNNRPSHFITPLAKPLELDKQRWSCAITEITFPQNWYNVNNGENWIKVITDLRTKPLHEETVEFPYGYYPHPTKLLIQEMQKSLDKFNSRVDDFVYNNSQDSVEIHVKRGKKITLSSSLAKKLGFLQKNVFDAGIHKADNPVDCNINTNYFWVYSNVVSESLVGSTFVKLLRIIPSEDIFNNGTYRTIEFFRPQYKPIASSFENNIEIRITTDEAEDFGFNGGKVIITLHFKKDA